MHKEFPKANRNNMVRKVGGGGKEACEEALHQKN